MGIIKEILISILFVVSIISVGTSGFMFIEKIPFSDSLYMTVITLTTVGYGDIVPHTKNGKYFTIFIIFIGLGIFSYFISHITTFVIEGNIRGIFRRNKLMQRIKLLDNHHIICGLGKIGKIICSQLYEKNIPFVVIEKDKEIFENNNLNYLYIIGDATQDETLINAGIKKCKTLVTALNDDAANVYVTLTARGINESLFILARKSENISAEKLYRAGASKVISPDDIGANHMVQILINPSVTEFISETIYGNFGLSIEEILIRKNSFLIEKTLVDSGLRQKYNSMVIGVKEANGNMHYNPSIKYAFKENDKIIIIGPVELMKKLREDV